MTQLEGKLAYICLFSMYHHEKIKNKNTSYK